MIELNDATGAKPDQRTYVIFGSPRGGTTMVAGACRLLGLHIGKDLPDNLEDPAFRQPYLKDRVDRAIAERNAEFDVWGWKFPRASNYLQKMHTQLRNPYYICIFRDHVAASARKIRRGVDVLERLEKTHAIFTQNVKFLGLCERPALLVSYEKAIDDPEGFVRGLQEFLQLGDDDAIRRACEFVKPGGYQSAASSDVGDDDM